MSFKQTPDLVTADPQGGKKAAAKDLLVSVGVDPGGVKGQGSTPPSTQIVTPVPLTPRTLAWTALKPKWEVGETIVATD